LAKKNRSGPQDLGGPTYPPITSHECLVLEGKQKEKEKTAQLPKEGPGRALPKKKGETRGKGPAGDTKEGKEFNRNRSEMLYPFTGDSSNTCGIVKI